LQGAAVGQPTAAERSYEIDPEILAEINEAARLIREFDDKHEQAKTSSGLKIVQRFFI
jgi:hypothetical protein